MDTYPPINEDDLLVIEAGKSELRYWKDIWLYRELFYFLVWRDLLVRYKQTAIGVAWALIRPALTMLVLTVVFGRLAQLPSDGVPYPILVFSALLPWQFFASAFSDSSNSMISNIDLISKIYFPRVIVPASAVLVCFVDLLLSGVILLVLMIWYSFIPNWQMLTLPFFILLSVGAAFGCGIWTAALNVKYRDIRYVVPFVVQLGLYISPVGFSSSIVPEEWRLLYSINPMVGIVDGFRWAIIGGDTTIYLPSLAISVILVIGILFSGLWFFRKTERTFADFI
jgi:lipopolysaccharide transport system permease protein